MAIKIAIDLFNDPNTLATLKRENGLSAKEVEEIARAEIGYTRTFIPGNNHAIYLIGAGNKACGLIDEERLPKPPLDSGLKEPRFPKG